MMNLLKLFFGTQFKIVFKDDLSTVMFSGDGTP